MATNKNPAAVQRALQATAALGSWTALNDVLRGASEEACAGLLRVECAGKQRVQYMLRIHARYNKLRAERERRELVGGGP